MKKVDQAIMAILNTSLSDSHKQAALLLVCENYEVTSPSIKSQEKSDNVFNETAFVYLIKNFDNGQIKIGFSCNPQDRIKEIKTSCHSAKLIFFAKGTMDEEKYLHEIYSNQRIKNEWFSLSNIDIKDIQDFLLEEREIPNKKTTARGRGSSSLIGYKEIEQAIISGRLTKISVRGINEFVKSVSINGTGMGDRLATVILNQLKANGVINSAGRVAS